MTNQKEAIRKMAIYVHYLAKKAPLAQKSASTQHKARPRLRKLAREIMDCGNLFTAVDRVYSDKNAAYRHQVIDGLVSGFAKKLAQAQKLAVSKKADGMTSSPGGGFFSGVRSGGSGPFNMIGNRPEGMIGRPNTTRANQTSKPFQDGLAGGMSGLQVAGGMMSGAGAGGMAGGASGLQPATRMMTGSPTPGGMEHEVADSSPSTPPVDPSSFRMPKQNPMAPPAAAAAPPAQQQGPPPGPGYHNEGRMAGVPSWERNPLDPNQPGQDPGGSVASSGPGGFMHKGLGALGMGGTVMGMAPSGPQSPPHVPGGPGALKEQDYNQEADPFAGGGSMAGTRGMLGSGFKPMAQFHGSLGSVGP